MSDLKVGDVVTLKSGGPNMIIDTIDKKAIGATAGKVFSTDTVYAWVSWFDDKQPKNATYPLTSLMKPKPRRRARIISQ